jgi:hypothetical protein
VRVPDWWEFLLLSLAAWRLWYLLAHDEIMDRPRRYVTRLGDKWEKEGDPTPKEYRIGLGNWIECPYCSGAWVALAWWIAWLVFPTEVMYATVPFALSAGLVGSEKFLS